MANSTHHSNQEEAEKTHADKPNSLLERTPSNHTAASKDSSDEAPTIYYSLPPSPKEARLPRDEWTELWPANPYLATTSPREPSPASNSSSVITVIWAPPVKISSSPQETTVPPPPPDVRCEDPNERESPNEDVESLEGGCTLEVQPPSSPRSSNTFNLDHSGAPSPDRDVDPSPPLHLLPPPPPPPNSPVSGSVSTSSSMHVLDHPSAPSLHRVIDPSPPLYLLPLPLPPPPPPPNSSRVSVSDAVSISSSIHAVDVSEYTPLPSSPSGRYSITPSMTPLLPSSPSSSSIPQLHLVTYPATQNPTRAPAPATNPTEVPEKETRRNIWGVLYGRETRFAIAREQQQAREEAERRAAGKLQEGNGEGALVVLAAPPEEKKVKKEKKSIWRRISAWFRTHWHLRRNEVSHAGISTKLP